MKFKALFISCISTLILVPSCIKEEGLDREADILSVSIENPGFLTTLINEDKQKISLMMEGDLSKYESGIIVPQITVSPYATVSPKSEEPIKLDNYKKGYVVRAEDGSLKKYELVIATFEPLVQGFEEWYTAGSANMQYDVPGGDGRWKTANPGVAMQYHENKPFPTRKTKEKRPDSEGEYSVLLETVLGANRIVNVPLYAGNMFTGVFDTSGGINEPLKTTKFGQPHSQYLGKPLALTAWYKYTSGKEYQTWDPVNKTVGEAPAGTLDKPDIYAILYKVAKGDAGRSEYLTAEDIKTSSKIVATAIMEDQTEKKDWTELKLKFVHRESLDFVNNDYKLAVVLSSSERGAFYEGAPGSELTVDDLRVVFERDEDAYLYQ